jgi:hypothetical protein
MHVKLLRIGLTSGPTTVHTRLETADFRFQLPTNHAATVFLSFYRVILDSMTAGKRLIYILQCYSKPNSKRVFNNIVSEAHQEVSHCLLNLLCTFQEKTKESVLTFRAGVRHADETDNGVDVIYK